jgi:hypothetical protein
LAESSLRLPASTEALHWPDRFFVGLPAFGEAAADALVDRTPPESLGRQVRSFLAHLPTAGEQVEDALRGGPTHTQTPALAQKPSP